MMVIYSVYLINSAGSLIYYYDHNVPRVETEKTFGYPLDLKLVGSNEKIIVDFGERGGIKVGHSLLAINGRDVNGLRTADGIPISDVLSDDTNYPINLKFGRPKLTVNERIALASMFHSLFVIASQLSPEPHSSGIEVLEVDNFRLQCFHTVTGLKFIVISDPKQAAVDTLLRKIYEIYADFALKNPFYSLDMPIRGELFEKNLQLAVEQAERSGITNI